MVSISRIKQKKVDCIQATTASINLINLTILISIKQLTCFLPFPYLTYSWCISHIIFFKFLFVSWRFLLRVKYFVSFQDQKLQFFLGLWSF